MKSTVMIAIPCLLLTMPATGARAEFVVETVYRESAARVTEVPPVDWTLDGDLTLEWGSTILAAAAMRDDANASASQSGEASWDGPTIMVAGTQHVETGRSGSGDAVDLWTRNLVRIEFTNGDPFVLHVEWEKTEYPSAWFVTIMDELLHTEIVWLVADDPMGGLTIPCSGSGVYTLTAEHILSRRQSEPGVRSGDLSFSILLGPEGTVPSRDETWSSVKSLYR